jgi:hypothetical protein
MSVMWISVLAQGLLRGQPRPVAEAGGAIERRGRKGSLQEVAARDHGFNLRCYSEF